MDTSIRGCWVEDIKIMPDIRQSKEWVTYLSFLDWKSEKIDSSVAYIKKLGFIGSLIKITRSAKLPTFGNLRKLAKKYRPLQITFEPDLEFKDFKKLKNYGFELDKWPLSPSKTVFIDTSQSEEKLLSRMHPKTRYNILLAKRKDLRVKISKNIDLFAKLWLDNMRKKGNYLFIGTKEIKACWLAFEKKAKLVFVYKNNELLAGVFLIVDKNVGHYMFAASNKGGNKLFAPTLVAWEAIRLSKKNGAKIFDFEGIYDSRYDKATKNWKGFSRFKLSFGGYEVEFAGTYTKHYFPLLKIISRFA